MANPRTLKIKAEADLEAPRVMEPTSEKPKVHIVGSNVAVETLLAAEKTAAAYDIKKAIITEVAMPISGLILEWATWYLTEHAKRSQDDYQNQAYNQINPVDSDWGQTVLNFALPITIATIEIAATYRGSSAALGSVGIIASGLSGAAFKALGLNDRLPADGACRSAIHAGIGMVTSSLGKASAYLVGSRIGTFFTKPETTSLQEHLISNEKDNIARTDYHELAGLPGLSPV